MKIVATPRTQHHLLRLHAGDTLPDTLTKHLREHKITGGWLRLTGVLADVDVRAFSAEIEGQGGTKRINGPVQAVVLDGSIGVADGGVSLDLRVVLARETDRGLETVAGELVRARVVGLEGSMVVLEDAVIPRGLDKAAGVWLLRDEGVLVPVAAAAAAHVHASPPPTPPPPLSLRVRPSRRQRSLPRTWPLTYPQRLHRGRTPSRQATWRKPRRRRHARCPPSHDPRRPRTRTTKGRSLRPGTSPSTSRSARARS